MNEQCRALHPGSERQCEDQQGHEGDHYFKTYVEWVGCWSCGADPYYDLHSSDCEAVLEVLDAIEDAAVEAELAEVSS